MWPCNQVGWPTSAALVCSTAVQQYSRYSSSAADLMYEYRVQSVQLDTHRLGPRLGGLDLTNGRISCQIRLAEHAALACVRDCVADLKKTSASISAAGLFQVRQQESKAGEQGTSLTFTP